MTSQEEFDRRSAQARATPEYQAAYATAKAEYEAETTRESLAADFGIPRVKGSNDHDWKPWNETPLGRGRTCRNCHREDNGYQQPCAAEDPTP